MSKPQRIGLLGGSFNPAHDGHLHLSREALKRLQLDTVWWLVSPANPLKERSALAEYDLRFAKAQAVAASEPRIHISDFERRHGLRYTVDTVRALTNCHPGFRCSKHRDPDPGAAKPAGMTKYSFIFLMGADNLACLHRWKGWRDLAQMIPFAVFDRAPHSHHALRSIAGQSLRYAQLPEIRAAQLGTGRTPAWTYIHMPRRNISATSLRNSLGSEAFLRHNDSVNK